MFYKTKNSGGFFKGTAKRSGIGIISSLKKFNQIASEASKAKKNLFKATQKIKPKTVLTTKQVLDLERKEVLKLKQEELKEQKDLAKINKLEKEIDLRKKVPFAK